MTEKLPRKEDCGLTSQIRRSALSVSGNLSEGNHLEILLEDIREKFDLVLEGHGALHKEIRDTREELCEKINVVDFKVETLNSKIDAVATDLTAHRRDTEAHPSLYKIKEGK
jgi:hypothetical protein